MRRFHHASLDSTNREAQRLAASHPGEVLLVSADVQTAGKGRTGRAWSSPVGGAWFSVLLPTPPITRELDERLRPMPLLAGLAVLETLDTCLSDTPVHTLSLKWPNDVLLGGRKVAGVLCERLLPAPSQPQSSLVVGIGVNLNCSLTDIGPDTRFPATSLLHATGRSADLQAFIVDCARRVEAHFNELSRTGLSPDLVGTLRARLAFLEQSVTLRTAEQTFTGTVAGLSRHGELLVRLGTEIKALDAGEVFGLTPLETTQTPRNFTTM